MFTYKGWFRYLQITNGWDTGWCWNFAYKTMTCVQHTRILMRVQHTKSYLHAKKVWFMCFLLVCGTQCIAHMQHTKYTSHALHKFYSQATHFVSHACVDWVARHKLKTTCVLGACECQLRCELYRMYTVKWCDWSALH